jgi:TolA-binding protein
MSDGRHDERWGRFERDLIRSAKGDTPSRGARRRALVALGGGGGGALGSSAAGTSAAAGHTAGVTVASKLTLLAAGKWLGLGVVGIGAVATAVHVGRAPPQPIARAATGTHSEVASGAASFEVASPEQARSLAIAASAPGLALEPQPPTEELPSRPTVSKSQGDTVREEPARPSVPNRVGAIPSPTPIPLVEPAAANGSLAVAPPTSTGDPHEQPVPVSPPEPPLVATVVAPEQGLAEELSSLDAARAALRRKQPRLALRALDDYSRAFPNGALEPEAIVLSIEVRLSLGDRAEATALGKRFLEAFPESPLARRVRAVLGL